MFAFLASLVAIGLAADPACDVDQAITSIRTDGNSLGYACVAAADDGGTHLLTALLQYPSDPRLSRALAVWMLQRADTPFEPMYVAKLAPADKRLLADGVRARRGRRTPVPEHARVFEQFDWYKPVDTYTDGRLHPGDKEQIALLEKGRPVSEVLPPKPDAGPGEAWYAPLLALHLSDLAERAIPAALLVGGAAGAIWYLRKPKA